MRVMLITVASLAIVGGAGAQSSLARRILDVDDGTVRLAYGVREGICGDGETFIRDRTRGQSNYITYDNGTNRGRDWRNRPCEPGPARVAITKTNGAVTQ